MRCATLLALVLAATAAAPTERHHALANQASQTASPAGEQKAKAVVVQQNGDDLTLLIKVDGRSETKSLRVTSGTKAEGLKSEWKLPARQGTTELSMYDLKGKTAEVTFRGGTLTMVAMQVACNNDFCPVKQCAKKCGAKPCTCES